MQMDLQSVVSSFLCGQNTQAFHYTNESPSAHRIEGYGFASCPSENQTPL